MESNWSNNYGSRDNRESDRNYSGRKYNSGRNYGSPRMHRESRESNYDDYHDAHGDDRREYGHRDMNSGRDAYANPGRNDHYRRDSYERGNDRDMFDRAGDRIRETWNDWTGDDRRDERNMFERAGDRIRDAWNEWTDDDHDRNRGYRSGGEAGRYGEAGYYPDRGRRAEYERDGDRYGNKDDRPVKRTYRTSGRHATDYGRDQRYYGVGGIFERDLDNSEYGRRR